MNLSCTRPKSDWGDVDDAGDAAPDSPWFNDTPIASSSERNNVDGGDTDISDSSIETDTGPIVYSDYPFADLDGLARVTMDWTPVLADVWGGIKSRNVDAYQVPMVHRPRSEMPGDAVSEGIGYGMILALYSNDQDYFNKIWGAGEDKMWNGLVYNWRCDEMGNVIGQNGATDAEEDIAAMLIFADHLVRIGRWSDGYISPKGAQYAERAQNILNAIWGTMVQDGRYLKPGDQFGSADSLNPGYFAPAFYRVFRDFDSNPEHDWETLIDQCYTTIEANPGYDLGLLPDWMNAWGDLLADGPGYNAYDNGRSMFKDGIRVYWRLAADALWFGEPRAMAFLENAMAFIKDKAAQTGDDNVDNTPAHLANFYQMNGEQVPLTDVWTELNGGNITRYRNEHSHLTIGMWGAAAIGSGDMDASEAFSRELSLFYEGGDAFGLTVDPSGRDEDQAHNELYFDQFLAWFGAAVLNGNFCNILECVK